MRGKSLLAFAMAIGCGLVAMVGVQQLLSKKGADPDADKVTVYVAATEIPPGTTLDMNMLERRKFFKDTVPEQAVTDPKQLEKRALTCKVMPGDIIRVDKLGAEGKTGASISIPAGYRVISVPTTTTQAHSGMIQPGDRVDVMVTYRVAATSTGGRDYPETKTVLGYIQVFATDAVRDIHTGGDPAKQAAMKNVSLLVTPDQAQILMMAQNMGELCLSLRNAGDTKEVETANLNPDQFRNLVAMNGKSLDDPDTSKKIPAQDGQKAGALDNFLDEAAGKKDGALDQPKLDSDTENWDIAFYGKEGLKIETIQVSRRPVETPVATKGDVPQANSVMGSLLNMFQGPAVRRQESTKDKPAAEPQRRPDNKLATVQPTSGTQHPTITINSKPATSSIKPTKTPQK